MKNVTVNIEELEKEICEKMGDGSAESQSITPVLKESGKTATARDLGMIWAGAQMMISTWAVGALAIVVFGLDLKGAISAIIVGNIIGGIMVGTTSLMGKHGAPQMLMTRYSLGIKGSAITSFLNFISTIGWFAANSVLTVLAAFEIMKLLGFNLNIFIELIVLVIIMGLQLLIGLSNFKMMKKIEAILVIPTTILIIIMTFIAVKDINWITKPSGAALGSSFNYWSMWISAVGSVGISFLGSWSPYASDFTRYFKFKDKKSSIQAFTIPIVIGSGIGIWLEIIGAAFASKYNEVNPALHIAKSVPAFALPALLIVLAGLFSANVLNLINGGLSAKVIWKKGTRLEWTALIAIIGSILAGYSIFVSDVASLFHTFLIALLIWEAPWFAVVTVDYFVTRKGDYRIEDLYMLNNNIPDYNKNGMIAFIIGFIAAYLTCFTGNVKLFGIPLYSPIMLKYFNGMDISFFVGAIVAAVIYFLLSTRNLKENLEPVREV